jgi:uncharacterized protein YegL
MNDDDFKAIDDFFKYISNMMSSQGEGTKRRINRGRSKGFRNENLNVRKGKTTTDLIINKATGEKIGSNKKRNRFDSASYFNPLHFIDDP